MKKIILIAAILTTSFAVQAAVESYGDYENNDTPAPLTIKTVNGKQYKFSEEVKSSLCYASFGEGSKPTAAQINDKRQIFWQWQTVFNMDGQIKHLESWIIKNDCVGLKDSFYKNYPKSETSKQFKGDTK